MQRFHHIFHVHNPIFHSRWPGQRNELVDKAIANKDEAHRHYRPREYAKASNEFTELRQQKE